MRLVAVLLLALTGCATAGRTVDVSSTADLREPTYLVCKWTPPKDLVCVSLEAFVAAHLKQQAEARRNSL